MLDERAQSLRSAAAQGSRVQIPAPSFSLLTDPGSSNGAGWGAERRLPHWSGSARTRVLGNPPFPTRAAPHPRIPARAPVPRHPLTHQAPSPRPPHARRTSSGPHSTPPRQPPTRQAGGGVDPLEQLPGAQLAARVGVRGLDGLAHAHFSGRRALHGPAGSEDPGPRASGRIGPR